MAYQGQLFAGYLRGLELAWHVGKGRVASLSSDKIILRNGGAWPARVCLLAPATSQPLLNYHSALALPHYILYRRLKALSQS